MEFKIIVNADTIIKRVRKKLNKLFSRIFIFGIVDKKIIMIIFHFLYNKLYNKL